MLNIAICEDEQAYSDRLILLLTEYLEKNANMRNEKLNSLNNEGALTFFDNIERAIKKYINGFISKN